ncbi:phenylpropionate dioxygenase-like ring-hydroxylating dioxygenase large terminal subunit [Granulicella arctica]|uniref:Phenylpropionate dioxygenase-like ring-hydroxylating dioxygenase large terminal subunit n=1 Tax=Granulicella arctica TaxID=940613 RepID=A0A7Y9PIY3_9BACT|nr:phenylpropionate dioxygenase-like ring-hydroxylating dioxygenase large terminal subunit [Granulicella arctica]
MDIFGFAGRQIEGFLDVAHFGFVHADTFGDPNNTLVPPYLPKSTGTGFEVEYRSSIAYRRGLRDMGLSRFFVA